ncbi:MAG: hydrogenase maturation protease [Burkholderiaceae bacterium]|nr:hydrogenase maturation protease [Burkholderiaceae bacterium]
MTPPLLVFGWGNASRGDDALGPQFVDRLRARLGNRPDVELIDDYQLMVEHALDLAGRERVLFVDASLVCAPPFETRPLLPAADRSLSSHALSPQALMQVFRDVQHAEPPPCTLLAIRGERFELGAPASGAALAHLDAALQWAQGWLAQPQEVAACTS